MQKRNKSTTPKHATISQNDTLGGIIRDFKQWMLAYEPINDYQA